MTILNAAVVGYGNLGKGAEAAIQAAPDMRLAGIFTRRDPASLATDSPCYRLDDLPDFRGSIDVCLLCGGSATDLFDQAPWVAGMFNTADSFDTHARIPEYHQKVQASAAPSRHAAVISAGWDPGLFSLHRLIMESVLPQGSTATFWGPGVSQGHSDAVRRLPGVLDAVQYTIPREEALEKARLGQAGALSPRDKHRRVCYVLAQEGADTADIERQITTMPNYFSEYDTEVHFISADDMARHRRAMPHAGRVIRQGRTVPEHGQLMEFSLQLSSNPGFTASALVAYARAACRLASEGCYGAFTAFDVPPAYLSPLPWEDLVRRLM